MRENRISIRALMVLAAELGAEHFYGVRDPFLMMDADEIRAAYELCLDELERAEIITRRMDGISVVRDDLRRQIQICMDCDRYLTKDAISAGHELPSRVFYQQDEQWVCLRREGDVACLVDSSAEAAADEALEHLMHSCGAAQSVPAQTEWNIANQMIQHCLQSAKEGRAELLAGGMPEDAAELLVKGLERQCCYCCINAVDLNARTLESVCLVYDSQGVLQLSPVDSETADWVVQRQTPEQVQQRVFAIVQKGAAE